MTKRILFFALHNPWPPRTGEHVRYLQILEALLRAGYVVDVASSTLFSETKWTEESRAGLKDLGVREVYVQERHPGWRFADRVERAILRRTGWRPSLVEEPFFCPVSLRVWFHRLVKRIRPEVLYLNHGWMDQLVRGREWPGILRLMEAHFFIGRYEQLSARVERLIADFKNGDRSGALFATGMGWAEPWTPDPAEVRCYERYPFIISISRHNQELIVPFLKRAKMVWIPLALPLVENTNDYSGSAVFMAGPNCLNQQGLLFFIHEVLPLIRAQAPDFQLEMTGKFQDEVAGVAGVRHLGFVKDLAEVYGRACMCLCPVFVTIGQQIKIVEGMAHGLPVVAMRGGALSSPLVDGKNGFITETAKEFAEQVVRLWRDRALCRELGAAARQTLREWAVQHDGAATLRDMIGG